MTVHKVLIDAASGVAGEKASRSSRSVLDDARGPELVATVSRFLRRSRSQSVLEGADDLRSQLLTVDVAGVALAVPCLMFHFVQGQPNIAGRLEMGQRCCGIFATLAGRCEAEDSGCIDLVLRYLAGEQVRDVRTGALRPLAPSLAATAASKWPLPPRRPLLVVVSAMPPAARGPAVELLEWALACAHFRPPES